MQAVRYSGPLIFPLAIPLLYALSRPAPLLIPLLLLFSLLATERIVHESGTREISSATFRWIPAQYIFLQLTVTLWAAHAAMLTSSTGFIALVVGVGACAGVFGMLAAHEMIHSRVEWHRRLGIAMLLAMSYGHFRISHIHGHHRFAVTSRDPSTARLGETFYAFLARTLVSQAVLAWTVEKRRCREKAPRLLHNRVVQDALLMAALYGALLWLWGWRAAAFLAAQSVVAILVLELFNYVAHYGLAREDRDSGAEPISIRHSWNSSGAGNLLLFNMGRHSDHHRSPSISYENLRPKPEAPELPFGYAGSILLALVPPLWRTVMDKRVYVARGEHESRYAPESHIIAALP